MRYVSYLHRNRGYKVCRLSVCPSICLPAYLPACLYVCLSVRPSVCLPACLSICLSVCLSVQDASNLRQLNEFGWNFAQRWRYVPDCVSHFDGDHPRGPAGRAKVYNWGRYCISFALTNFILLVRLYRLSVIDKVLTTSRPRAILTIWSLFNPFAVPAPHLLSPFPADHPSPHWKSQIAHSSSRLCNQLPDSFRQPHHSCLDSTPHPLVNPSLSSSPISSSNAPSLFHSRLKTYLFNRSFPT